MARNPYNFFHWNCRGLRANREEIDLLISKYSPVALCLQEVLISNDVLNEKRKYVDFRNHSSYYHCTESGNGGVVVIVKNIYAHSEIPLDTNLQAVAIRITIEQKVYTICSIYIPPSVTVSKQQLNDLKSQLPAPYILMGDFNAHNGFWGSSDRDKRGEMLEEFILEQDLLLFNNKKHTYFKNDYSSLLDLTLCQPSVFLDFSCKVFETTNGSDHCPIQLIHNIEPLESERNPQWNFRKANWAYFREYCCLNITSDIFNDDSEQMILANGDKMSVFF